LVTRMASGREFQTVGPVTPLLAFVYCEKIAVVWSLQHKRRGPSVTWSFA